MLLELDIIGMLHGLLGSLFSRLILAGYTVLPDLQLVKNGANSKTLQNLIAYAILKCLIGVAGIYYLSWICRRNYDWLLNRIIM
jgi:H+/Cl- antiporter ClcA